MTYSVYYYQFGTLVPNSTVLVLASMVNTLIITSLTGTILHYQNPNGLSCPVQDLSFTDGSWTTLENARLSDTTGLGWNIIYKPEFISTTNQPGLLRIKMARDSKSANMLSGGYWRFADFANTSTYQVRFEQCYVLKNTYPYFHLYAPVSTDQGHTAFVRLSVCFSTKTFTLAIDFEL